jgi:hypothetical protein
MLDCHYQFIQRSNEEPWHLLHAVIDFLNHDSGFK